MKENFVYYNRNPKNEIDIDCVVRAISLALNQNYYLTEEMLINVGYLFKCEELEVDCYSYLLENVLGFKRRRGHGRKVEEILRQYPTGTLLIRIEGHLTCAIDGKIRDIWDCTDEIVDRFWIVE